MALKNNLLKAGLLGILATAGCNLKTETQNYLKDEQTIKGVPISVSSGSYDSIGYLSVLINKSSEEKVLCSSCRYDDLSHINWNVREVNEGKTLTLAEINDRDEEEIELRGKYKDNKFIFTSLTAEGYTIDAAKRYLE